MSDVIELRRVERLRNCFRYYRIAEGRTLFGEPCLMIQWGRIGGRLRVRVETFAGRSSLSARRAELLARRRRHGYSPPSAVGNSGPLLQLATGAGVKSYCNDHR
jgi:predicted DNA-binding WGR domain protein